jgi:hypothetical protein
MRKRAVAWSCLPDRGAAPDQDGTVLDHSPVELPCPVHGPGDPDVARYGCPDGIRRRTRRLCLAHCKIIERPNCMASIKLSDSPKKHVTVREHEHDGVVFAVNRDACSRIVDKPFGRHAGRPQPTGIRQIELQLQALPSAACSQPRMTVSMLRSVAAGAATA